MLLLVLGDWKHDKISLFAAISLFAVIGLGKNIVIIGRTPQQECYVRQYDDYVPVYNEHDDVWFIRPFSNEDQGDVLQSMDHCPPYDTNFKAIILKVEDAILENLFDSECDEIYFDWSVAKFIDNFTTYANFMVEGWLKPGGKIFFRQALIDPCTEPEIGKGVPIEFRRILYSSQTKITEVNPDCSVFQYNFKFHGKLMYFAANEYQSCDENKKLGYYTDQGITRFILVGGQGEKIVDAAEITTATFEKKNGEYPLYHPENNESVYYAATKRPQTRM